MTKDVLITISGSQVIDGEAGEIEMITIGDHYQKNGKHYVRYEEVMEGFDGVIKNTIKIWPDCMDIMKTGLTDVHMRFEKGQKRLARYLTPMGEMLVGLDTKEISLDETDDSLKVQVRYLLDIDDAHIAECNITVDIQSRSQAHMDLHPPEGIVS
ncbi:MAG: DUF1934 domain-containing protein [Lachnospiraceae bacterium]|nr:DUF1934 domain-containing protein [Lachnospiraceae bacterium]